MTGALCPLRATRLPYGLFAPAIDFKSVERKQDCNLWRPNPQEAEMLASVKENQSQYRESETASTASLALRPACVRDVCAAKLHSMVPTHWNAWLEHSCTDSQILRTIEFACLRCIAIHHCMLYKCTNSIGFLHFDCRIRARSERKGDACIAKVFPHALHQTKLSALHHTNLRA